MIYEDDNIKIIPLSKEYFKKLYLYRIILKKKHYFYNFNELFKGILSSKEFNYAVYNVDIYDDYRNMSKYSPVFKIKQDNNNKILYF